MIRDWAFVIMHVLSRTLTTTDSVLTHQFTYSDNSARQLLAPTRAQYGSTCSSSADCTDVAYPHCSIYWMDQTLGANTESYSDPAPKPSPAQVKGVCVQCRTDCDCAVNQYCGAGDISIAAEISRNSGTAGQ